MGMHHYKELKIWQRSMDLVVSIYKLSAILPKNEQFGLLSQMQRCAVSVPSNIAEGAGRGSNKQFRYFLAIAMGSINELQTQVEIAFRLNYLETSNKDDLTDEMLQIYKMVLTFYKSLGNDE
ncbi:four helix bundle protein [Terrimonas rubra]|uniref:Four helix bundle protein n=1 Tax=Terrimonas rubra TaxID=1035890 RepID=A0ABW6A5Y5_9BACT